MLAATASAAARPIRRAGAEDVGVDAAAMLSLFATAVAVVDGAVPSNVHAMVSPVAFPTQCLNVSLSIIGMVHATMLSDQVPLTVEQQLLAMSWDAVQALVLNAIV